MVHGLPYFDLPTAGPERYWFRAGPAPYQVQGRQVLETGGWMAFSIGPKFEGAKQFLREVKTELKKVTWPSRKDTLSGTVVVLVTVFIIAIFLGIVDSGLSNLIKGLLKRAVS
jgi:preprotein translocase subunit SecE